MIKVTIWNEFVHEKEDEVIKKVYPEGIHNQIASFLKSDNFIIRTATLDKQNHGLSDEILNDTDVLIWWGHVAHGKVDDEIVNRVYDNVHKGMGLIVLHSGHNSKIFKKLMGTTCNLKWRDNDRERLWCVNPTHPIAQGVPEYFELENEEMYGEFFDIPTPEEIIYLGWFKGGEVFRSAVTFTRGMGKIFYFQPGHEQFPTFYNENVKKIITNAVYWAKPRMRLENLSCVNFSALEREE